MLCPNARGNNGFHQSGNFKFEGSAHLSIILHSSGRFSMSGSLFLHPGLASGPIAREERRRTKRVVNLETRSLFAGPFMVTHGGKSRYLSPWINSAPRD